MPDSLPATTNLPERRKRGRPSTFTPEVADIICDRLEQGESLRAICRDDDMPPENTVRRWNAEDTRGFSAQYAQARNVGLDSLAESLLDISDDSSNDFIETEDGRTVVNSECVQRSRLRVDTRKWILSKLAPKRYGDRLTLAGDADSPVKVDMDHTAQARRVAFILAQAEEPTDTDT